MKRLSREHLVPNQDAYSCRQPAIEVENGETFVVETINSGQPIIRGAEDVEKVFIPRQQTGPIFVRGIEPGDLLAIEIHAIRPEGHARSRAMARSTGYYETVRHCFLEIADGMCRFPGVGAVPLRPMIGEIHVTPTDVGTLNPGDHGGNMDVTLIGPGNVLYLRSQLAGGLVVLGDLHGIMGQGESFGIAAEMAGEVTLTIRRDNRLSLSRPAVFTGDTMAFIAGRISRREAIQLALEDATAFVRKYSSATEEEARLYVIDTADLRNGGVFLEDRLEDIPTQVRTVFYEMPLGPLCGFPTPVTS
jgi:amidase